MIWIKPLDTDALTEIAEKYDLIVTVEDGVKAAGFGSAVEEWLAANGSTARVRTLGIPDNWVYQGSVAELRHICGFDAEAIAACVEESLPATSATQP